MMAATFRNKSSIITEHHGWRAGLSNAWPILGRASVGGGKPVDLVLRRDR